MANSTTSERKECSSIILIKKLHELVRIMCDSVVAKKILCKVVFLAKMT